MCERLEKWISTLVGVGKKSKVNKESTVMVSSIRRRVLTVALSFCVVLTTIPVAAFGPETPENTGEGGELYLYRTGNK